ncbi:MAG: Trm112 family protein [Planctomycetes bacterium]|nr:Trm112 family protein [Planctomycetota bacterium]
MLDPEFLKLLACPKCKVQLIQEDETLLCQECGRRFPVRDGVPVLLIDQAEEPVD